MITVDSYSFYSFFYCIQVSWADDKEVEETKEEEDPVIFLPSSTTPIINQPSSNHLNGNGSTFDDNMDLDSNNDKDVQINGRKRLATGLPNLGNTCFMNSTLQCLANTEPIRRYFLSGEYQKDLNKDNPLGTGGQLATQFAYLMGDMWGIRSKRRNILGSSSYGYGSYSSYHADDVNIRPFKQCVGRHASQFMGYDQHDSQEFATYLLDALHEDTNRVTKKPYIEKPEQGEDEPDDVAAKKAWSLHLQRENSRVLDNFMGQVKSRLECCEEGCNRVSTTFDPFMYLSVPIPGSTDRDMEIVFVPLDPMICMQKFTINIPKTGLVRDLLNKVNEKLIDLGFCKDAIPLEDLYAADVWSHEIHAYYKLENAVDLIQSTDKTHVYQLRPLKEIREVSASQENNIDMDGLDEKAPPRVPLDLPAETRLKISDQWGDTLGDYRFSNRFAMHRLMNRKVSTHEARMEFHKKLENFLDECHQELEKCGEGSSGLKRTREESDHDNDDGNIDVDKDSNVVENPEEEEIIQGLVDRCEASETFANVKTKHDVAVLEYCSHQMRHHIIRLLKEEREEKKDGVIIQVNVKEKRNHRYGGSGMSNTPILLRLPGNTTVYDLRKELAHRLSRSLIIEENNSTSAEMEDSSKGELSAEQQDVKELAHEITIDQSPDSPQMIIMRQTELTFAQATLSHNSTRRVNFYGSKTLGMVNFDDDMFTDGPESADPSNESEQNLVAEVVGELGAVCINWETDKITSVFNSEEFESYKTPGAEEEEEEPESEEKTLTVLDCIKSYCQKEQLEETEMWYCNKCKNHVRAWKQFHLYRTPPFLIIHLKRFYFSSSSLRRDKISTRIDFPLEGLDLTDLVAEYDENEKPIYDCYGVSNHYGGLGGGHYTAYILSDVDGTWSYYDDRSVTTNVDPNEVVSAAAYVLYYRRRDIPVGEDRDFNYSESSRHTSSPMSCEPVESQLDQQSEISSNNTAQAGDMDVTVDDLASNGSSGDMNTEVTGTKIIFPDDEVDRDDSFLLQ